jgi:hypothetical protein
LQALAIQPANSSLYSLSAFLGVFLLDFHQDSLLADPFEGFAATADRHQTFDCHGCG